MYRYQIYVIVMSIVSILMCLWNYKLQKDVKTRENLIDMLMIDKMREQMERKDRND